MPVLAVIEETLGLAGNVWGVALEFMGEKRSVVTIRLMRRIQKIGDSPYDFCIIVSRRSHGDEHRRRITDTLGIDCLCELLLLQLGDDFLRNHRISGRVERKEEVWEMHALASFPNTDDAMRPVTCVENKW